MKQYHDMLRHIMDNGVDKRDRTGTGTRSVFGYQMRFDLKKSHPLLATKFTPYRLVVNELLWFLKGNPDISYLHAHNNHIWDEWVKADGTFGPIYGKQWRSWPSLEDVITVKETSAFGMPIVKAHVGGIDQIQGVIDRLRKNPDDRRMLVSAWNVADVESGEMALPPCHVMFQFYTRPMEAEERHDYAYNAMSLDVGAKRAIELQGPDHCDAEGGIFDQLKVPRRALSCQLYQRSADSFLGVPFNISSYATLTSMIAQIVGMAADEFIWTGGDVHIYSNHFAQVEELLSRDPETYPLPQLKLNDEVSDIDEFEMEDFELVGYTHGPKIAAPVAV